MAFRIRSDTVRGNENLDIRLLFQCSVAHGPAFGFRWCTDERHFPFAPLEVSWLIDMEERQLTAVASSFSSFSFENRDVSP